MKFALFKTNPLELIDEKHAGVIRSMMKTQRYASGDTLKLDRGYGGWWVIEQGLMKVYQLTPDGNSMTFALLSEGDTFGETAVLTGHWLRATVEALEPTVVRYLPAEQFETIVTQHPTFAVALLRILADRIRQAEERVLYLSRFSLEQRIAYAVVGLARALGQTKGDHIEINLSHQEIADYVGASREAVSRCLSQWAREGWVETSRKSVSLLNEPCLRRIADKMADFL